jgi:hypothetical protein
VCLGVGGWGLNQINEVMSERNKHPNARERQSFFEKIMGKKERRIRQINKSEEFF